MLPENEGHGSLKGNFYNSLNFFGRNCVDDLVGLNSLL